MFAKHFQPTTISFLELIMRHKREMLLIEIFEKFIELHREHMGIIEAEVFSAVPLNKDVISKLKSFVEKKTGYSQVVINNSKDENLIGGFALKYKDKLLDFSIANKLELLRQHFSN